MRAEDEPILSAPGACKDLECGGGSTWRLGAFNAGAWGSGEARGRRLVFKCSVNTREGREAVELQLTLDGFIFLSAESFKAVAVRKGELLQVCHALCRLPALHPRLRCIS